MPPKPPSKLETSRYPTCCSIFAADAERGPAWQPRMIFFSRGKFASTTLMKSLFTIMPRRVGKSHRDVHRSPRVALGKLAFGTNIDINNGRIIGENVVSLLRRDFFDGHVHLAGVLEYWNDGVLADSDQHSITPRLHSSNLYSISP